MSEELGRAERKAILPDARRTAFHEAGHAVIARWFGLPVKQLEIYENLNGKMWFHDEAFDSAKLGVTDAQRSKRHSASLVAGSVCEEIEMGDSEPSSERTYAISFMRHACSELGGISISNEEATAKIEALEDRIKVILLENWQLVSELASELERRKVLDGPALEAFLNRIAPHELSEQDHQPP